MEVWCFVCGESGHIKMNCPKTPRNNPRKQPSTNQSRAPAPANRGGLPAARTNQPARNAKKPQAGGRMFCLKAEEGSEDPHAVVSAMFPMNSLPQKSYSMLV